MASDLRLAIAICDSLSQNLLGLRTLLRRAGSDPLLVGPAGNHSASFRVGLVSAKMRLVLAIIVWYVVCKSLSCFAVLLRSWLTEWAKRRNTLLGPKLGSDIAICSLRLGGGSRSGEFIELSVLRSPGPASQNTGAAHGPRHPSCYSNQTCWVCSCCFGVLYETICGIGVQPILGCLGDESPSALPFKLWPLYGSDRHLYSE